MKLLLERLQWAMNEKSKRDAVVVTQADLTRATGATGAAVNHWISGTNGIGGKYARLLAEYLGVDALWLETGKGSPEVAAPALVTIQPSITAYHPDDPHDPEMVYVPESKIEFSAGNGRQVNYEIIEDEEPATYRLSWFRKYGINPNRVRRFRVSGDSMEPMLFARDTILVNEDERNVIDGKMYAIRYGDELRVKYLSRRLDGTLLLRSVNPAYAIEEISPDMVEQHISIIGRVRDTSGTGGL